MKRHAGTSLDTCVNDRTGYRTEMAGEHGRIEERTKHLGVLWAGEDTAPSSGEVSESKMSKSQMSAKRNKRQKVVLDPQTVIPKRS
jgi:hypothetical protein